MPESGLISGVSLCEVLIVEILGRGTRKVVGKFQAELALDFASDFIMLY